MVLIVEDGTGLTNSESYVSVADASTYNVGYTADAGWSAASVADKERALRLATQYLDSTYALQWRGVRANETQALDWPRKGVVDNDGFAIDDDALPQDLINANIEMGIRQINLASGAQLLPDLAEPGTIKTEYVKVGPIEERLEYFDGKGQFVEYTLVDEMLSSLTDTDNTTFRA